MDQERFHIEQAIERLHVVRRELVRIGNINLAEIMDATTKHLQEALKSCVAKRPYQTEPVAAAPVRAPEPPPRPPKAERSIPQRSKFGDV